LEKEFWLKRWQDRNIAFHQEEVNLFLVQYFKDLGIQKGDRIFVPLCGKTLDIAWLLAEDFQVVGVELSEQAIKELFSELNENPTITHQKKLIQYKIENLTVFVGDFFDLDQNILGKVDGIYDRAALVALPDSIRIRYVEHLQNITNCSPQLVITYEYDQTLLAGPPFSISDKEINKYYRSNYKIEHIIKSEVSGGFKGQVAFENVWKLRRL